MVYNSLIQLYFVRVPEHYWMFHNCNHVVARWLRALDVDVGGLTTTSDFRSFTPDAPPPTTVPT